MDVNEEAELVARLREGVPVDPLDPDCPYDIGDADGNMDQAADLIDRLTRERDEATAKLAVEEGYSRELRARIPDLVSQRDEIEKRLKRQFEKAERERDEARERRDSARRHIAELYIQRDVALSERDEARQALTEISKIERLELQEGNCGQEPEYEGYWSALNRARQIALRAISTGEG